MNTNVLCAVFKRNFTSYFANPTGYVFICVFVLLSSIATFWPHEFFAANLANLDQLNWVFPLIMLIFIPAITMSIWAEERRLGTDELLLTIPAGDLDIVLGKYLAAVAIYTISLCFSFACNLTVLKFLGEPDIGLFLSTYLGYWLVGLAMLAIGMVASFLTSNLTVGFVFGALLNAPLVLIAFSDVVLTQKIATKIADWSIGEQFMGFGRGVISLSGVVYFVAIVVVMIYLSVVLIGRRHWARDWFVPAMHYAARTLSLGAIAVAAAYFFHIYDLRADVTEEKLSMLSPRTTELLEELELKRPVKIEAFVSSEVPKSFVQQKLNLETVLREIRAACGDDVRLYIHNVEENSPEIQRAEDRYGITTRNVVSFEAGTVSNKPIVMGVAFICGLEKVIVPFIDEKTPVEYELIRSMCTVTNQDRKTIGILKTDAQLYGSFNMQTMSSSANWPIVTELEKMYDVEEVDPAQPITKKYDALLAVQPSSLGPQEMQNFIEAVKSGQPTAIFEDPFPGFASHVPGTNAPRRAPGGMNPMMMMQQRNPPKGNIKPLWDLLGVKFAGDRIIWKDYNPLKMLQDLEKEFVFVDDRPSEKRKKKSSKDDGSSKDKESNKESNEESDEESDEESNVAKKTEPPFNKDNPISSKLELMLFPFPGTFTKLNASDLNFDPLIKSGEDNTGNVLYSEMLEMGPFGPTGINPRRRQIPTNISYNFAAHIYGDVEEKPEGDKAAPKEDAINVVLVSDIDLIHAAFFRFREQRMDPRGGMDFNFDNVTFVLNALDVLAGDKRFIDIRSRRPKHRTLSRIDDLTEAAKEEINELRDKSRKDVAEMEKQAQEKLQEDMLKLRKQLKNQKIPERAILTKVALALQAREQELQTQVERREKKDEKEIREAEMELAGGIRSTQKKYKMAAVLLPPILPLLLAAIVFIIRRSRESEGVKSSRMR